MSLEAAISTRWDFLGLKGLSPLRLTRLGFAEVVDHCIEIDFVCLEYEWDKRRFSDAEIQQCRQRLIRFAKDQFDNRMIGEN